MFYSRKGVLGIIVGVHAGDLLKKLKHIKLIMSSFFIGMVLDDVGNRMG